MDKTPVDSPILSVSELNQYARGVLEMHVGKVWVTGEISNFACPASGHWYFTLKDSQAQVRCAMFKNRNSLLRTRPQNGMQVLLQASASLYEGRGEYQLIVDYLEESGVGTLQRQFEQLKSRLADEGLFDSAHKVPLPSHPKHIAVITSATGAAVHDILKVLNARFPGLRVTLIATAVQGTQASEQICQALLLAERWNSEQHDAFDAIILGRGGGSLEDLWPFNEESVARAIYACKIPVISAVGHEVDVTISDYVADVRAPTPSAAAELISPDQQALMQQLDHLEQALLHRVERQLQQQNRQLQLLQQRLRHPGERLQQIAQRLNTLQQQLNRNIGHQMEKHHHHLQLLEQRFSQHHPKQLLQRQQTHILELSHLLQQQIHHKLQQADQQLGHAGQLLEAVSPLATLQRGYAIVSDEEAHIVRSAEQVQRGQKITARLAKGQLHCEVLQVTNED